MSPIYQCLYIYLRYAPTLFLFCFVLFSSENPSNRNLCGYMHMHQVLVNCTSYEYSKYLAHIKAMIAGMPIYYTDVRYLFSWRRNNDRIFQAFKHN